MRKKGKLAQKQETDSSSAGEEPNDSGQKQKIDRFARERHNNLPRQLAIDRLLKEIPDPENLPLSDEQKKLLKEILQTSQRVLDTLSTLPGGRYSPLWLACSMMTLRKTSKQLASAITIGAECSQTQQEIASKVQRISDLCHDWWYHLRESNQII